MTPVRKLTFQLASLLDLLLIVMFALYLEMQTLSQNQNQLVEAERQTALTNIDSLKRELLELQNQLADWELKQKEFDRVGFAQQEQLGDIIRELFKVPDAEVQKIAKRRGQDSTVLSPSEVESLQKRLRELASARSDQVIDYLLTFSEMKKRFDLWEIYIEENGSLSVDSGTHQKRLQTGIVETSDQFSEEMFKLYKSFPQSKSVVLILVSYGDSRLSHRLAVINGLPEVTERMRTDSNGTVRFEYAVLGYRPTPPTGD